MSAPPPVRDPDLRGARVAFEELPVIDIGALDGGNSAASRAVVEQLGWAARNTGFFYVTHHGISQTLIDDTFAFSRAFFSLPLEQKMAWHYSRGRNHSGYLAIDQEITDSEAGGDFKEGLDYFFELPPDDPDYDFRFYGGPNLWIDTPSGYRELLQRCFGELLELNRRLLNAMLQSVGVAPGALNHQLTKPIAVLSPRRYPPQNGQITRSHLGANMHEDWCCCTVIAQDEVPGLQAMNADGRWIEVLPLQDTLVCNLGELLERWTNGQLVATQHRVINDSGRDRYSIPAFLSPNRRSQVSVLPQCQSEDHPPRFGPLEVGEYFQGRHQYDEIDATRECSGPDELSGSAP